MISFFPHGSILYTSFNILFANIGTIFFPARAKGQYFRPFFKCQPLLLQITPFGGTGGGGTEARGSENSTEIL